MRQEAPTRIPRLGGEIGGAVPPPRPRVPVGAPPHVAHAQDPGGANLSLAPEEAYAVRRALLTESNPNHLIGFAGALRLASPVAASLLYARAQLLELRERSCQEERAAVGRAAALDLAREVDHRSGGRWSGARTVHWICDPPLDTCANLHRATEAATRGAWPDACRSWTCPDLGLGLPALPWPRRDRILAARDAVRSLEQAGASRRSDQEAALALVQPIEDRRSYALGSRLQDLGFADLYRLTHGPSVRDRAEDLLEAHQEAQRRGTNAAVELVTRRRRALETFGARRRIPLGVLVSEVGSAAGDLVVDPSQPLEDLPPEIGALARALVVEVGPGIRIVDPGAARIGLAGPPRTGHGWRTNVDLERWVRWHVRAGGGR